MYVCASEDTYHASPVCPPLFTRATFPWRVQRATSCLQQPSQCTHNQRSVSLLLLLARIGAAASEAGQTGLSKHCPERQQPVDFVRNIFLALRGRPAHHCRRKTRTYAGRPLPPCHTLLFFFFSAGAVCGTRGDLPRSDLLPSTGEITLCIERTQRPPA